MTYDQWKATNPADRELGSEGDDDMEREWMRDIRPCEGCGEQTYDGARYLAGSGEYLGWLCADCLEFAKKENEE